MVKTEVEGLKKNNKELETDSISSCSFKNKVEKANLEHIDKEDIYVFPRIVPSAERKSRNIIMIDDESSNANENSNTSINVCINISSDDEEDNDDSDEDREAKDDTFGGSIVGGSKNDPQCSFKSNESRDEFSKVRKGLPFEDNGCSSKKMALSTPGVAQTPFSGVIDISDEDVNYDETPENKYIPDSSNHAAFNKTNLEYFYEEDLDDLNFHCSNSKSAKRKRKRAANIIASDDETSDNDTTYDDNALSRPKIDSEDTECASKRRLTRLRKLGSKSKQDTSRVDQNNILFLDGHSSSEDEDDDDDVEGSKSEDESLSDFINDSPEIVSEGESASESSEGIEEPENVLNDYKETIYNIRRKKVSSFKWDLQGEMQADFGKYPELCMRAVCAIYRRQTEDEKASNVTIHQNKRGFSKPDANTASDVAQFLTDGDSKGDLSKTVEELESYDVNGIELCRSLAFKYSNQLFEIYQNKEDPYFLPQ